MAIIIGTEANDLLTGGSAADSLQGLGGADTLQGGDGDDLIDGGAGSDTMAGGAGSDIYVVDAWDDAVVEAAGEGVDEVRVASSWYLLPDHVENLTGTAAGPQSLSGNELANVIRAGACSELAGGGGDDSLHFSAGGFLDGGDGDDLCILPGTAADYLITREGYPTAGGASVRVRTLADGSETVLQNVEALFFEGDSALLTVAALFDRQGTAADDVLQGDDSLNFLHGGGGDDTLHGLGGNDLLDGGAGADTMVGGLGGDVYFVDDAGDAIVEAAGEGYDHVHVSSASYTMAANVEAAHVAGGAGATLIGNAVANQLWGGAGDDWLEGRGGDDHFYAGGGADMMVGGTGNDSYIVEDAGDLVVEAAGGGTDTVHVWIAAFVLPAHVENVDLGHSIGVAKTLTGNAAGNVLTVSEGPAWVDGGGGNDTVVFGHDGDSLLVDLLTGETGGAAADDVLISVENLVGGEGDDELRGTAAANVLDGGLGADVLVGRGGNDIYIVDDAGDLVVEAAGEGTDEVRVAWLDSYALPDNVEKLRSSGTDPFSGTGNALNNDMIGGAADESLHGGDGHDWLSGGAGSDQLYGDAGHDTLSGGAGGDRMEGGDGNDVFIVDNSADVVVEAANEGIDQIYSSLAVYLMPEEVEVLSFNGQGGFQATGNGGGNTVYGGGAADVIDGAGGDDELRGASGDDLLLGGDGDDLLTGGWSVDILVGGAGADLFRFAGHESGTAAAADRITDFAAGTDRIDLSAVDADAAAAGDQAFAFVGAAAFSGVAGELRHWFDGTDTWLQADTDGDSVADFEIVLSGAVTPMASDLLL